MMMFMLMIVADDDDDAADDGDVDDVYVNETLMNKMVVMMGLN